MKRKLSLVIVAVFLIAACFTALSACAKMDAYFLETMRDDLRDKTEICGQTKAQTYVTNASFTLPSSVKCLDENDKEYAANVSWTVVGGSGKVTMGEKTADGYVVTVPAQGDSDVTYVLVATLTDAKNKPYADANGNPYTVEFSCKVAAKGTGGNSGNQGGNTGGNTGGNQGGNTGTTKTPLEQIKEASVSAPTAGTNYLMVMYQGSSQTALYVTGKATSGNETFLETTSDKANAATVTVEAANGGFYIRFTAKDSSSAYLGLVDKSGKNPKTNVNLVSDTSSAAVYTVGTSNILTSAFGGNNFFLGTFGTHDTVGSTSDFYITGTNSGKLDVEQWAARLIPADTTIGGGTGGSGNTGNTGGDSGNQGNQGGGTTSGVLAATLTVSSEAELRTALTREGNTNVYKGNGIEISNGCDTDPLNPGTDKDGNAIAVWKEMRYYANSSFTVKYGTAMTKIVITFTNDKLTEASQVTVSGATATLSGKQLILTFNSPVTEITVQTTKQIRATVVEIYC